MYSFAKFTMYQNEHYGCLMWSRNCLPFRRTWVHQRFVREVRMSRTLGFCLVCCRSLCSFVLLSVFVWTLYYLYFKLRFLITPLVSLTFSCLSSLNRILRLSFVFMFILLLICLGLSDIKISCFPSISMYFPVYRYCLKKTIGMSFIVAYVTTSYK
jgi:hypothetical protein